MRWVPLLLATLIFSGFALAAATAFKREKIPNLMKLLSIAALATFGLFTWQYVNVALRPSFIVIGAALQLLSGAIFSWAIIHASGAQLPIAFSSSVPDRLLTSGPYCFVRHPLYASYTLFWIGCCLVTLDPLVTFASSLLIAAYIFLAKSEERKLRTGMLAASYEDYMTRTGLFLPKTSRLFRVSLENF